MSAVAMKLLEDCTSRGIRLRPGKAGMLRVSPPPEKLPAALREELVRHKPALLALLASAPEWPCPTCGAGVRYDPADTTALPSRFWSCGTCTTWGVTRAGTPYPVAWIRTATVQ